MSSSWGTLIPSSQGLGHGLPGSLAVLGADLTKGISDIYLNSRVLRKPGGVPCYQRAALNVCGVWGKDASPDGSSWSTGTRSGVDPFCLSARTQYPEGPPRACLDSAHRSKLCPRPLLNAPPCLPPGSSSPQAGVEHVLEVTLGHLGRGFWASGTRALEGATSSGCAHFLGTPFREEGGGQRKVGAAPLKHRDPGGDPSILSL